MQQLIEIVLIALAVSGGSVFAYLVVLLINHLIKTMAITATDARILNEVLTEIRARFIACDETELYASPRLIYYSMVKGKYSEQDIARVLQACGFSYYKDNRGYVRNIQYHFPQLNENAQWVNVRYCGTPIIFKRSEVFTKPF